MGDEQRDIEGGGALLCPLSLIARALLSARAHRSRPASLASVAAGISFEGVARRTAMQFGSGRRESSLWCAAAGQRLAPGWQRLVQKR